MPCYVVYCSVVPRKAELATAAPRPSAVLLAACGVVAAADRAMDLGTKPYKTIGQRTPSTARRLAPSGTVTDKLKDLKPALPALQKGRSFFYQCCCNSTCRGILFFLFLFLLPVAPLALLFFGLFLVLRSLSKH